jgi:hypothetical protein
MQNSHVIIFTALIILGLFSAGCASTTTTAATPVQTLSTIKPVGTTVAASSDEFTIVEDHTETGDYGSNYVVGTIKSNVNKQFTYVQVTVSLYDASGAQVGSTLANVNNLDPYGTWKFKAPILDKDAVKYKMGTITAW